ncbi:MAG TPA: SulP family inorganic anion transporter [Anaerolineales bacterium]|nr:SulP family inorganic anion transporter [Anaerolineales bacterium]
MNIKELKDQFEPRLLLPSLIAGLIAAIITISLVISLAALIFSGDLSQFLGGGIGLMLFGAFIMGIVISLTSSLPGTVGLPQDTPAAILALVAAGIGSSMSGAAPQAVYATITAAILITSILTGIFLLLLGRFKASGFVRYIPYPVIGGFLAGTGWLIALGGLSVMTDLPLNFANLPMFFRMDLMIIWVPGLIFGIALLLVLRRSSHFLITPGAVILATLLFYAFMWIAGISTPEASARGWLLGPFPSGGLYQPLTPSALGLVHWQVILQNVDKIATILVLTVIAMLLNASALEVTVKQDIDLNRELQSAGWANLAAGLGGSPVGYQALGMSALAHRIGAKSRLVNLISGLVCGAALFFGASLISYFPKPVLGGLLFYLGLAFLVEWLVDARKSLPLLDYLLVWVILVIIAAVGFLEGIIAGIFIAAILFVISYSRINAIKNVLNGSIYRSKVDRPKLHRDILTTKGTEIYILRLQGYIFFGTVQSILEKVRLRLGDPAQEPLKFLIIDFHRVPRLDSSAVFGITRLKQLTHANKILMVWTEVSADIINQLERGGHIDRTDDSFIIMPSLDEGVEWCENKILADEGMADLTGFIERVETQLKRLMPGMEGVERLMKYLERREVQVGEYLMKQNEASDEMYFVESGMVSVEIEMPNQKRLRVRTIRGGATVGEMGIYLGGLRTASVVASRRSVVYRLSLQALKEMRENDPEIAAFFHEWIARLLAERVADNNRMFEALMD